jgi:hypothetical protein
MSRAAPRIGTHNDARIIGVVGASGMGKGATTKSEIIPLHRGPWLVWSPLEETDQYGKVLGVRAVRSLPEVVDAWRAGRSAVYEPPLNPKLIADRFDLFCRAVWHMPGAGVIVEELSRVTTPSWAPGAWRNLSTAGRHRGLTLVGTCQRPAQVDKDFFGNCSEIRCFRVNYENDARVMSNVLRLPPGAVLELQQLTYIRRDINARHNALCQVGGGELGAIEEGRLVLRAAGAVPKSTAAKKKSPPRLPRKAGK